MLVLFFFHKYFRSVKW